MLIYVAGPYSKGDVTENIRNALKAADEIWGLGHTPVIPHLCHLWHAISPKKYQEWLAYGQSLLWYCDAILRLPGSSLGADKEVEFALRVGIMVYYNIVDIPKI